MVGIRYFTALVSGVTHSAHQKSYLRALETLPKVRVILGHFKPKKVECRVQGCTFAGIKEFTMSQEKRTDVNIAVHMLDDAYKGLADNLVLVSGDSDLVPALTMVRQRFPDIQLYVYVPSQNPNMGTSIELREAAHVEKRLPLDLLKHSQFPAKIEDGGGGDILRPLTW